MTIDMAALKNDPDFLFLHSVFVRNTSVSPNIWRTGGYVQTPVYRNTVIPIGMAYAGSMVLIDGRLAVVSGGQKNIEVRFQDDGMPGRIHHEYSVTIIDRETNYAEWGYPKRGEIVKVLKGEHADRVGIVYGQGKLSTYVAFPGTSDKIKFNAKALQIVKGHIVLD